MTELSKSLGLSRIINKTDTVAQFMAEGHAAEIGLKPADVDQEELWMGSEVELEHTKDRRVATKIAMDHFAEFPKGGYYHVLSIMEKFLKSIEKLPQDQRMKMIADLQKLIENFVLEHKGEAARDETESTTSETSSSTGSSPSPAAGTSWHARR